MKNNLSAEELINIVISSFDAESSNNTQIGRELITDDFKQRGMYVSGDKIFPVFAVSKDLDIVYSQTGRLFHIWNVAANESSQTVFVELAETEPREGRQSIWPYVLVSKIEDGKIKRSRHYGDPRISKMDVSIDQVRDAVED